MRIAIVGAGISGLVAAHLLHREHEIVLYEAGSYVGGHTNTVRVDTAHGTHEVDTGFIVMNDRNYPNFTRLLDRLGVATQPTHMSFSVKAEEEDFEYAGTPRGLFCQPSNIASVRFQRMIVDCCGSTARSGACSTGEPASDGVARRVPRRGTLLAGVRRAPDRPAGLGRVVGRPARHDTFPVRFLAEFFSNHGMLGFRDRPRWSTVAGGSARYVEALTAPVPRAHPAEHAGPRDRALAETGCWCAPRAPSREL